MPMRRIIRIYDSPSDVAVAIAMAFHHLGPERKHWEFISWTIEPTNAGKVFTAEFTPRLYGSGLAQIIIDDPQAPTSAPPDSSHP